MKGTTPTYPKKVAGRARSKTATSTKASYLVARRHRDSKALGNRKTKPMVVHYKTKHYKV